MVVWERVQHGNGHSLPDNEQERDGDIVIALVVMELRVALQNIQNDVYQLLLEHGPLWRWHAWERVNDQHMEPHSIAFQTERSGGSHWPRHRLGHFIFWFPIQAEKKNTKKMRHAFNIAIVFKLRKRPKLFPLKSRTKKNSWAKLEMWLAFGFVNFP